MASPPSPLATMRSTDLQLFTDASLTGYHGYGIVCRSYLAYRAFPHASSFNKSMTWREFYPILVACTIFQDVLAGKKICFITDHTGVIHILTSLSSYSPDIMELVRPFILQCLKCNIHFTSSFIPSASNSLADALSRQYFQVFSQAPNADPEPTPIPSHLMLV